MPKEEVRNGQRYIRPTFGETLGNDISRMLPSLIESFALAERTRKAEEEKHRQALVGFQQLTYEERKRVLEANPEYADYLMGKKNMMKKAGQGPFAREQTQYAKEGLIGQESAIEQAARLKGETQVRLAPFAEKTAELQLAAEGAEATTTSEVQRQRQEALKSTEAPRRLVEGQGMAPPSAAFTLLTEKEAREKAQEEAGTGPLFQAKSKQEWVKWYTDKYGTTLKAADINKYATFASENKFELIPPQLQSDTMNEYNLAKERISLQRKQLSQAYQSSIAGIADNFVTQFGLSVDEGRKVAQSLFAGTPLDPAIDKKISGTQDAVRNKMRLDAIKVSKELADQQFGLSELKETIDMLKPLVTSKDTPPGIKGKATGMLDQFMTTYNQRISLKLGIPPPKNEVQEGFLNQVSRGLIENHMTVARTYMQAAGWSNGMIKDFGNLMAFGPGGSLGKEVAGMPGLTPEAKAKAYTGTTGGSEYNMAVQAYLDYQKSPSKNPDTSKGAPAYFATEDQQRQLMNILTESRNQMEAPFADPETKEKHVQLANLAELVMKGEKPFDEIMKFLQEQMVGAR